MQLTKISRSPRGEATATLNWQDSVVCYPKQGDVDTWIAGKKPEAVPPPVIPAAPGALSPISDMPQLTKCPPDVNTWSPKATFKALRQKHRKKRWRGW